jgi:hypothetical protein
MENIISTLSSTKLEIRAKQFLPGSKGMGGEMTQTLYAHMNKRNVKKRNGEHHVK